MAPKPYLSCTFEPGLFPHEYLIRCPGLEQGAFVNRSDVTARADGSGLVRILLHAKEGDRTLVGINDVAERGETRFSVPRTDIYWVP